MLIEAKVSPGLHTYSTSSKTVTLAPLFAGRGGGTVLPDPEASGEEGGVGNGRGIGVTSTVPDAELGARSPLAGAAEELSGMKELPSVGGLGGEGDIVAGAGVGVGSGTGFDVDAGGGVESATGGGKVIFGADADGAGGEGDTGGAEGDPMGGDMEGVSGFAGLSIGYGKYGAGGSGFGWGGAWPEDTGFVPDPFVVEGVGAGAPPDPIRPGTDGVPGDGVLGASVGSGSGPKELISRAPVRVIDDLADVGAGDPFASEAGFAAAAGSAGFGVVGEGVLGFVFPFSSVADVSH